MIWLCPIDGISELELPDTLGKYLHVGLELGYDADVECAIVGDDVGYVLNESVVGVNLVLCDSTVFKVQVDDLPHVLLL